MSRWVACLYKWAGLVLRRQRVRLQQVFAYPSGGRSRPPHQPPQRQPVQTLEPRLLFSAAPVAEPDALFAPADHVVGLDVLLDNDHDDDGDPLSVVIDTGPAHGTFEPDGQGGLVYRPEAGYVGDDSFSYRASDGPLVSAPVQVSVTVGDPSTVTDPDVPPRWINLSGDAQGALGVGYTPRVDLQTDAPASVQSWQVDWGDGVVEPIGFDPVTGQPTIPTHTYWQAGSHTIRLTAIDDLGRHDAAITIEVVDDIDLVQPDSYTTAFGRAFTAGFQSVGLLGNDALPGGAWSLTLRHPTDPAQDLTLQPGDAAGTFDTGRGSLVVEPGGTFTYTPHAGVDGLDAFTYEVDDGQGQADLGRVQVWVRDANTVDEGIQAADWTEYLPKGSVYSIDDPALGALGRATDADGDLAELAPTQPTYSGPGVFTLNPDGTLSYDPGDADFIGTVSLPYELAHGQGGGYGTITLVYEDHAPVVGDDHFDAVAGLDVVMPAATGLLALGSDADGDTLALNGFDFSSIAFVDPATPVTVTTAAGSSIDLYADGGYRYTPAHGFTGEDTFSFTLTDGRYESTGTVRITVDAGSVTLGEDAYTVRAGKVVNIPAESGLLTNDLDSHGRPLTVTADSGLVSEHGSVFISSDGSFSYLPDDGFVGEDRFTYTVTDGLGNTHEAEVILDVESRAPIAVDDAYTVALGQEIDLDLLTNDLPGIDGDAIHLETIDTLDSDFGDLAAIDHDAGRFTYTAPAGWSGTFRLSYTVDDGYETSDPAEVEITVLDEVVVAVDDAYEVSHGQPLVIDALSGLLSNDIGPADGLTIANAGPNTTVNGGVFDLHTDGGFTYTPDAGFLGTETIDYRLAEVAGVSAVGTLTIEVTNAAPSASNLEVTLTEDAGPTALVLPFSDTDPADAGSLVVALVAGPASGQIDTASWVYTSDPDFAGQDRLTYAVTDGFGQTAYGTVLIEVAAVNDAPVADPTTLLLNPDDTLRVDLRQYVTDADGDTLVFTQTAGPGSVSADGVFNFDPAGSIGSHLAEFDVTDGGATTTLAITLGVANSAPTGVIDQYVTHTGLELRVTGGSGVLANDADDYKQSVTATATTTTLTTDEGGSVTLEPNGGFVYTPPTLTPGHADLVDRFTYTPDDGHHAGAPTTVEVLVTSREVLGAADQFVVHQGEIVSVGDPLQGLLRNDTDSGGGTLTAAAVSAHSANGANVAVAPDGTFAYWSPPGFVGLDSFDYTVTNGSQTETVTVTIDVRNTAPAAVSDRYEVAAIAPGGVPAAITRGSGDGLLLNDYDADNDAIEIVAFTANGQAYAVGASVVLQDAAGNPVGTFSAQSGGGFSFTPMTGFVGSASVDYTLDDRAEQATGSVTFDITNQPATPAPDRYRYHYTQAVGATGGSVLANDYDYDAHAIIAALQNPAGGDPIHTGGTITTSAGGSVTVNPDGTFTYTRAEGFVGTDSFEYAPYDQLGAIPSTAWTTATIEVWNDLPLPASDTFVFDVSYSGSPPTVSGSVTDNDVLVNELGGQGSPNRVLLIDPTTGSTIDGGQGGGTIQLDQGTLTLDPGGAFTFTPKANYQDGQGTYTAGGFIGSVSFQYLLADEAQQTEAVWVDLTLNNHAPHAVDDVYILDQTLTFEGNVLSGGGAGADWDAEGDGLTVELLDGAGSTTTSAGNTVTLNADGSFTYTAEAAFDGTDSFSYRLLDGVARGKQASDLYAIGSVTLHAVNATAQAGDDLAITTMDQPIDGQLLTNDYLPTGQGLSAEPVLVAGSAYGGTAVLSPGGGYTFTPDPGYVGEAGFDYTLRVLGPNGEVLAESGARARVSVQPPIVRPVDDIFELNSSALTGNVLTGSGNGADVVGQGFGLGDLVVSPIGSPGDKLYLTSNGDFVFTPDDLFGAERFVFNYTAGVGANQTSAATGEAVIYYTGYERPGPNAGVQTWGADVAENAAMEIDALALLALYYDASDLAEIDPATIVVEQAPWLGDFTRHTGPSGNDVYTYQGASPGLLTPTVDGLVFSVADHDGRRGDRMTLLINVLPVPQVQNDVAATTRDQAVVIDVLNNDGGTRHDLPIAFPKSSVDAVAIAVHPTSGTAAVQDKRVVYTPGLDTVGVVSIGYRVTDQAGNTHDAQVTVNVARPMPDAPTAGSGTTTQLVHGVGGSIQHSLPITVGEGAQIVRSYIVGQGQFGIAGITVGSNNAGLSYTLIDRPGAGVTGDTVTYAIEDDLGRVAQGTLTIPIDRGQDPVIQPPLTRPAFVLDTPNIDPDAPVVFENATGSYEWSAEDHTITVTVLSGEATLAISANTVAISNAIADTHIAVLHTGNYDQAQFAVAWDTSNTSHTLDITSDCAVGGLTFNGDLTISSGGAISENISAKSIIVDTSVEFQDVTVFYPITSNLTANDGFLVISNAADISGNLTVTGGDLIVSRAAGITGNLTATGGDLIIPNAADISGNLSATGDIKVGQGENNRVFGDITSESISADGALYLTVHDETVLDSHRITAQTITAGGLASLNAVAGIDSVVNYGGSLTVYALNGDAAGTYTNQSTDESILTIDARSISADIDAKDSPYGSIKAERGVTGSITASHLNEIISSYGSISSAIAVDDLASISAALDFTGEANGLGTLGSIYAGRDIARSSLSYNRINTITADRDLAGTITLGADTTGGTEIHVGRSYTADLKNAGTHQPDINAGLDLLGEVTAEHATNLFSLTANRVLGVEVNAPGASIGSFTAGLLNVDHLPGTIQGADVVVKSIHTIGSYAELGVAAPLAGQVRSSRFNIRAGGLASGNWGIGSIEADGPVDGLTVHVNRGAGEVAINTVRVAQAIAGSSAMTITTDGQIDTLASGTEQRGGGELALGRLSAEHIGKLESKRGNVSGDIGLAQGIDTITVGGSLSGAITARDGDLTSGGEADNPKIIIGAELKAKLTAAKGDIGYIVTGVKASGGVSGNLSARRGTLHGVSILNKLDVFSNASTAAWRSPGQVQSIVLPEHFAFLGLDDALNPPGSAWQAGFDHAGFISANLNAQSIGEINTMGGLAGQVYAAGTIGAVRVFGEVTSSSRITAGLGGLTMDAWSNVNASIDTPGDIDLTAYGDVGATLNSGLGGIALSTWNRILQEVNAVAEQTLDVRAAEQVLGATLQSLKNDVKAEAWGDVVGTTFLAPLRIGVAAVGGIEAAAAIGAETGDTDLTALSLGDQKWLGLSGLGNSVKIANGDVEINGADYSGDTFFGVAGGRFTINGELKLDSGEAKILAREAFKGNVTVQEDENEPSVIRIDAGSIDAGTQLTARNMVLASNGDANLTATATESIALDAQGTVQGSYSATAGVVQVLAGDNSDATITGQLGVVVQARDRVLGTVTAPGGEIDITALNHGNATQAISGSFFGHSAARLVGWGGVKATGATGGRISMGGLDVFAKGDIASDAVLKAGGEVGVEAWGKVNGTIAAGDGNTDPMDAVVIAHDRIDATINATGTVQAVALGDLAGTITSTGGGAALQAGDQLTADVTAKSDIDVLARSIGDVNLNTTDGNLSAIALESATFNSVQAKGNIDLIAGDELTAQSVSAAGDVDAQGQPTLRPQVTLLADTGTLSVTSISAPHGDITAYAGTTAALTTASTGAAPDSVGVLANGSITGTLRARQSATATALTAGDGSAGSINLSSATVTGLGGELLLFARGTIGGSSFTATSAGSINASADGNIAGSYHAGQQGVSLASLQAINASVTTTDLGDAYLFAGSDAAGSGAGGQHITGSVNADGAADLFAADSITANVTARHSASASALSGDMTGSIQTTDSTAGQVAVYAGGDVAGPITAGHDAAVLARGDLAGSIQAGNDVQALALGDQSGAITAGGSVSLYADAVTAAIDAGTTASVTSATDITANITAHTGITASANQSISSAASLDVTGTGGIDAAALDHFAADATTAAGDINLVAGGAFTGSATAGWQPASGGGSVDVIAFDGFNGTIDAAVHASVTVLGNLANSASVTAGTSAAAATAGAIGNADITASPGGSGDGSVLGPVTSTYGSVTLVAANDLDAPVNAGGGDADITLGGALTGNASVDAHQSARVLAFDDIAGDITATLGDADLTTARAFADITVNAGNDINAAALQQSALTANAGRHIDLNLAAPAGSTHQADLTTAAGSIQASVLGDLTGSFNAGDNLNLFVLGMISGQGNATAGGDIEALAADLIALGTVNAAGDIDLATPNNLTATSITANRSVNLFAGQTTTISGTVLAGHSASITSVDSFTAAGVSTTSGDINVASQAAFATTLIAGSAVSGSTPTAPAIYLATTGNIGLASYQAPGDITLLSQSSINANDGNASASGGYPIDAGGTLRLVAKASINARAQAADIALVHTDTGNVSGYFNASSGDIGLVSAGGDLSNTHLIATAGDLRRVEVFGNLIHTTLLAHDVGTIVSRGSMSNLQVAADHDIDDVQAYLDAELFAMAQSGIGAIGSIQSLGTISGAIYSATIGQVIASQDVTASISGTVGTLLTFTTHGLSGLPEQDTLTWSVAGAGVYSVARVGAELDALDEAVRALEDRIAAAWVGANQQRAATDAGLAHAEVELAEALGRAVQQALAGLESVEKQADEAVTQTQDELARTADELAVGLRRGVSDTLSALAGLSAQGESAALRSVGSVLFAGLSLDSSIAQLQAGASRNAVVMSDNRAGSIAAAQASESNRDRDFVYAARAAVEAYVEAAKEEAKDRLQETINKISIALSFVPVIGTAASVVLDLVNASISLARGNYLDAALYGLAALPFIGDVAAAGRLGTQLAKQAGGLSIRAAKGAGKNGAAQLTVRHRSILGQTGGNCLTNSFAGDTGVVTGIDANGNYVTTAIEDLQIGDVVLAQDELNPDADPHYALVTGVTSRTVYEVHTLTYTDANGNTETLQTTANHAFFAINAAGEARWTPAEQLQPGEHLLLPDGNTATITANTELLVPEGIEVYNLSVSDGATYFVDDGQGHAYAVWVHNCGAGRHHLHPFSWGSKIARGKEVLGEVLSKYWHNLAHRKFSDFLQKRTGHRFKSLNAEEWIDSFGTRKLRSLTADFAREFGKTKTGMKLAEKMYPGKNLTLYEALRVQWKYAKHKGLKP